MRLDKYLKVSRLVKRRTVASDLCKGGHVYVNKKAAKASSEINAGDTLSIRFGNKITTVTILEVPNKPVPAQAADSLYKIISEEVVKSDL